MAYTLAQRLTERFYAWEVRGRGWQLFDGPVEPEPPFHPFFGHYAPAPNVADDGLRPTLLQKIGRLIAGKQKEVSDEYVSDIPPMERIAFESDAPLVALGIVLPKEQKVEMDEMEQLLLMLSKTSCPISFEILATHTSIRLQFVCREQDALQVRSQVKAFFPSAIVQNKTETGLDIIDAVSKVCFLDFGLSDEFMFPLQMPKGFDPDPLSGLFGSLECLGAGESITIQILFQGSVNPWAESIMRAVSDGKGGSFFSDAPEMAKLAREKVAYPLYGVNIRLVSQAGTHERAHAIAGTVAASVVQITKSHNNALMALPLPDEAVEGFLSDIEFRETHRTGMLLNLRELATLVHLPSQAVVSSKLERIAQKTKAAPANTKGHALVLGTNIHHNHEQVVSVPASLRLRHTHIIGATGTGKSTMLLSMIAQDMKYGNGLAVLDPHGDLIESILAYIPKERIEDVILIDPADGDYPVAFNILSAHSEIEKDILSSDLVAAFKRLSTSWGDQMNSVLANAILAFLESKNGGTLVDLRRFLVEKSFRDTYLKTVSDPHVVYYWQHEYPLLKSNSIGSILTRLDTFLRPKLIRNMVAQKNGLHFENILDTRKILLVKLSQGLIGAENSFLLGTFFVSKMYQAAMARQAKSKTERNDFFLYIDEFQNFITPSMSHILSGARKYHLGLILAHQDMQQLQKYDTELASSVVVNAGTRICFRLGDTDAKRFASGFSYFEAEDLENLHVGEAIARIEQSNLDFSLTTIPLPEIDIYEADVTAKLVVAKSREQYGTPKEIVEQSLKHLGKMATEQVTATEAAPQAPPPQPEQRHEPFKPVEIPRQQEPAKKSETQHRYLQTFIKRMAESRGYKAMIEESTPDGRGRVDVSLERAGKRIACEISVTTDDEWEAHNVVKCLVAGYDEVIVCSSDSKNLQHIRQQLENKLDKDQLAKVLTFEPDEVIHYFDKQIVQESSAEKVVKGYRVKVEFDSSIPSEMEKKQENVAKANGESRRKKK